ncbi:MAG: FHA domain-containing protein [Chloroflexi bacterium]|nr:MAG: FHA domain-containing protein [Chloroflexota bacterium]
MANSLEILTLGGLIIRQNGRTVTELTSRKALALLVYLAHNTKKPHAREVLAELFWEERSQGRSLANLRVVLTDLRKYFDDELAITRRDVGINPQLDLFVDSVALDAQLDDLLKIQSANATLTRPVANKLTAALDLYQGDFLDGFYVRDSHAFEAWASRRRERLRLRVIGALDSLVDYYLKRGPTMYSFGIDTASRLLTLDPLHEDTHRKKMLLLALIGLRGEALSQFERCRQLLNDELGVQPTQETTELYKKIQTGDIEPPHEEHDETIPLQPMINRAANANSRRNATAAEVPPPAPKRAEEMIPVEEDIVCDHCGHRNPAGALICDNCDEALVDSERKGDTTKNLGAAVTTGRYFADSSGIVLHLRDDDESLHISIPDEGDVIVGRASPESDNRPHIDLSAYGAAEHGVSRSHASLKRSGNSLVVTDLNSTNGTLLNGQKLHPGEVRILRDGDTLQFGNLKTHIYFQ